MISPINPQKVTPMKYKIIKGMWLLFGYGIIASILILMMMLGLFGDSTMERKENTMPQSMQRKQEM